MEKLNCESLMIGDWVLFSNEPKRVKSIVVSDNGVERIYVFGSTCQISTIEAYIQPVPLTPEILEKNCFEYKEPILTTFSEEKVWQIEDSNEQILIEIEEQTDDNLVYFYVARFICGCNNCELFIKHVHQLQHALRLCGIEKTIEL